jgi:hypothetical protein
MSMYNPHRGLPGAPNPNNARLNELLDSIRAEFENQSRASESYDHTSKPSSSLPDHPPRRKEDS